MKIIYLIHATYNSAGMERILALKANYLAEKSGHQVIIITTDQRGKKAYYPLSDKIICHDLGINFEEYYAYPLLKRIRSYLQKQTLFKKKLKKILLEEKADITISLMSRSLAILTNIQDGSKKIYEQHFNRDYRNFLAGSFIEKFTYQWRGVLEYKRLKKIDAFVVLTHEDAGYWGKLPNLHIIPNAITFIPSTKAKLDDTKCISIGRLEFQKGYDQLSQIWKYVYDKHPDWELEIWGTGKDEKKLQKEFSHIGLSENIHLKGSTNEIEKILCSSSIYVMTSRFEGFPMVLLEAMSCGLPIVAFRCPCGPQDIITDQEDGFLISPGNYQEMAEKINFLIEHEEKRKRMGENALKNIQRFSQEAVMQKWINLFQELTANEEK